MPGAATSNPATSNPATSGPGTPGSPVPDRTVGVVVVLTEAPTRLPPSGLPALIAAAVISVAAVLGRILLGEASAAAVVLGLVLPAVLVPAAGLAVRAVRRAARENRFRMHVATGVPRSYVIHGRLGRGALNEGDLIRVREGRTEDGWTVARSIEVLAEAGGPVIRLIDGSRPAAVLGRWLTGACLGLAVLLIVTAAITVAGLI
jgi:hypothetical protein